MTSKLSDFAYANDVRAAILLKTPRTYRILVISSVAFFVCAIVWASFAILDEVTRGNSRVIPSSQTQIVQTLEGGIVEAIHVKEGAIVSKSQILMRIDDTNFSSQFGELRERRAALAARVSRLIAEATGQLTVEFGEQSRTSGSNNPVAAEQALFDARAKKQKQDLEVIDQQEAQKRQERSEALAQEVRLRETLVLLERELGITRRLNRDKVVPEIELLRIERQFADARGQLEVSKATVLKLESAVAEFAARRATTISTFRAASEEDLAKSKGELAVVEESIRSAQDRVRRTDLRSPVRGIINKINVNTIGAVLQPAQNIMEIIPLDDTLLVEAKVRPADIAFIRPEQNAVVKITAYDSSIYGSLQGYVERISADTTVDENKETFYKVIVRTNRNYLGTEQTPLPIIPGMVGTVEVLTGKKSVMAYMLKPIAKVMGEALRER